MYRGRSGPERHLNSQASLFSEGLQAAVLHCRFATSHNIHTQQLHGCGFPRDKGFEYKDN